MCVRVCMCFFKFIMFTKVICDNPDHIKWYYTGMVFKGNMEVKLYNGLRHF